MPAGVTKWSVIVGSIVVFAGSLSHAQSESAQAVGGEGQNDKSFADFVKDAEVSSGYFDVYRNRETGDLYIGVEPGHLDQALIYAIDTVDSPVESGLFRGLGTQKMLRIRRHFGRLEFVNETTAFYHDPESPLSRAAAAHMTPAVLAVAEILAEDADMGTLLVDAKKLFLSEALQQIKATPSPDFDPKKAFALGELDAERSKVYETRSYPKNTDWFVDYVYANPAPVVPAKDEVPDSRFVSVRMRHSFIEAPEDGYEPRFDDYRVGFFTSRVTDLTSRSHTPYRDVIMRWDLRKSDPEADVSDVEEPIVWWIENTTPHEFRDTIREAVLAWNPVFEKAGLRNAIEVRVQPDDADWDAGDLRYNVLRWASSPQPPYGGIGPAFIDPRTGQVLGSDISLEYAFVTNRLRTLELFDPSGLTDANGFRPAPERSCQFGAGLQAQLMMGRAFLDAQGAPAALYDQMVRDALHYLLLHEVGHTLGLNHNMKSTQLLSPAELNDPAIVESGIFSGSVMDYPAIHFSPDLSNQTLFYTLKPGPYDDWAIEFGYSPDLDSPDRRKAHLDLSTRRELAFGNDGDDMRAPGAGIDPRVNIYDLSSDAISYASGRFEMLANTLDNLIGRLDENDDDSYQALVDTFLLAGVEYQRSAMVVSRYVGGVQVNRGAPGQDGAAQPYVPVSLDEQQRALRVLREYIFAPNAIPLTAEVTSHLQPQRRDFDFYQKTEDPKLHELVLAVQTGALDHLMHPVVLKRMTDSRLYGNEYSVLAMLNDLSAAIFDDDLRTPVNTVRQNLQMEYVNRLLAVMESGRGGEGGPSPYDVPSQAAVHRQLSDIDTKLARARSANDETQAHRDYLRYQIETRLKLEE